MTKTSPKTAAKPAAAKSAVGKSAVDKSPSEKSDTAKTATSASTGRRAGKGAHVFLVDGSSYIFRAYHALPPLTRKSDGLMVHAVLGFCNMLWELLRDMKPEGQ